MRAAAAKDIDKILSATLKIAIIATMPICRELEIVCGPDSPERLMAELGVAEQTPKEIQIYFPRFQ